MTSMRSPSEEIIKLEELDYTYPNGTRALRKVSMQIPAGSKHALLGPNGAGKSTLLLLLNGMLKPSSGRVIFDGAPLKYSRTFLNELRSRVGIVFQDPDSQLFSVNVYQDISFGPMNQKLPLEEVRRRVDEALQVCQIEYLRKRPAHSLSWGEKKKVAIAGVLAMNPEVLVLDEPTSALDPGSTKEILELLESLHRAGKTIVMSTHDMDFAYAWADCCCVLNGGEVAAAGPPGKVFVNSDILKNNQLQKPWVLKVFERLIANGLLPLNAAPPRGEEQVFEYIDRIKFLENLHLMAK